jgi:hypothetical protein
VVLRVEAQRSSFSALPCPTEDGFSVSCLITRDGVLLLRTPSR